MNQHQRLAVTDQSGPVRDQRGRLVEYYSNECTHGSRKGYLKPQRWRKYLHIRPIQAPSRPNDISTALFPAAVVYGQRHGTTKERFDRRQPPRFKFRGSSGSNGLLQQGDLRSPDLKKIGERQAEHRGETKPTDDIAGTSRRVYGPEKQTGSDPTECSLGMPDIFGKSAVSPAMRVQARSKDIPV